MNADFSEIRRLLESYYDGSLSPEGMTRLRDCLANTASLPDDLALERRMLDAIDSVVPAPPADLHSRLEKAIYAASAAEVKPKRRGGIILRFTTIAAIAACMAGLLFLTDGTDDLSPSTDPVLITKAGMSDTIDRAFLATSASQAPEVVKKETQSPVAVTIADDVTQTQAVKKTVRKKKQAKRHGARIITDPDEALAYFEAAFDKIAEDIVVGDRMIGNTLAEGINCNVIQSN